MENRDIYLLKGYSFYYKNLILNSSITLTDFSYECDIESLITYKINSSERMTKRTT